MLNYLYTRSERDNIRKSLSYSRTKEINKDGLKSDMQRYNSLFKSHNVEGSSDLHADDSYFCKNIKKIREERDMFKSLSNLRRNAIIKISDVRQIQAEQENKMDC